MTDYRFVGPDLFEVATAGCPVEITGKTYTAVYHVDFDTLDLWLYNDGSYASDIKLSLALPTSTSQFALRRSLQPIPTDPASLTGDHSILWSVSEEFFVYDPVADLVRTFSVPFGNESSPPLWGFDGWIYYLAGVDAETAGSTQLRKIRADFSGDTLVSTLAATPVISFGSNGGGDRYRLTSTTFYAQGQDSGEPLPNRVVAFPLDGSAPDKGADLSLAEMNLAPNRPGLPDDAGTSIAVNADFPSALALSRFTGPASEADLWPSGWVAWVVPNAGGTDVLSHSLSPAQDESVVYYVTNSSTTGLLRVAHVSQQAGCLAPVIGVNQRLGNHPTFMLARD